MTTPIKHYLQTIINPHRDWKIKLLYDWPHIIGALADKVYIESIKENSVTLAVSHSCWMQELYLLSPLLIKTINEKLDQPRIKHIRFKQAGIKKKLKKTVLPTTSQKIIASLPQEDEKILAHIIDPALRDILRAFRIRCYQEHY